MGAKRWTTAERAILTERYQTTRNADLAREIGRNASAIEIQARRMGLSRHPVRRVQWTPERLAMLHLFGVVPSRELAAQIGCTLKALIEQAGKHGIRYDQSRQAAFQDAAQTIAHLRTLLAVTLNLMSPERAAKRLGQPAATLRQVAIAAAMPAMEGE